MTYTIRLLLIGMAVLPCLSCSPPPSSVSPKAELLAVSAGPESSGPRLSSGPDGTLIMSWMQPDEVGTSLYYSQFRSDRWDTKKNVVSGANMFVNRADLPSVVALGGQRFAAHWLKRRAENTFSYDVRFSQSMDAGSTWSTPITPHTDNTPTEHGFVSIFAQEDNAGLIWLDGRNMVDAAENHGATSGMTLRAAFVDKELALNGKQLVDELICDCCQTDIAITPAGPIAAYRDRSVAEIRDIAVTRFIDGVWQNGRTVAADNWKIAGCPVSGPSIAAHEQTVAVAWFTAAQSKRIVKAAFSRNNGETFSDSQIVASDNTVGRVSVAMLDDQNAAVSWLQSRAKASPVIMVRKTGIDGSLGNAIAISTSATRRAVPQLARVDDYLIFAWSEEHDGIDQIASARLPISALDD